MAERLRRLLCAIRPISGSHRVVVTFHVVAVGGAKVTEPEHLDAVRPPGRGRALRRVEAKLLAGPKSPA